jgi:butyrate kinase (EC 2.7.2.7)
MTPRLLVINPGSTSTKIAVYAGEEPLFVETIRHDAADLGRFAQVMDQEDYRRELILTALAKHDLSVRT